MFVTDRFDAAAYDCFIVGSGPAGISLALALAKARKRVLVFESGDADQPRSELSNSIGYGHYAGEYLERALVPRPRRHVRALGRLVRDAPRHRPR